jgi:hypothetical protein
VRKTVVLLVSILVLTLGGISALAAESGYLYGPGASYSFSVNGPGDVDFSYPKGYVDFWVTVASPNGSVSNFDLDNGAVIQLSAGGMYTLTIYSKRGAGNWSASWGGGSDTYSPSNCNVSENQAWGYLTGTGDSCSFTVDSYVNRFSITFSYPRGSADFWVETIGQDGTTVLGNVDLDNGEVLNLSGGGRYYFTIYSNRGAGNWSCTW